MQALVEIAIPATAISVRIVWARRDLKKVLAAFRLALFELCIISCDLPYMMPRVLIVVVLLLLLVSRYLDGVSILGTQTSAEA